MAKIHYIRKYENEMTYASFKHLFLWTCMTHKEGSELTGVTIKTFRVWLKENNPPLSARRLIEWYYYGTPQIKEWGNWRIRNGLLISPAGEEYSAKDVEIMPMLHKWRIAQERDIRLSIIKRIK